jgi:hypothetical protein
MVAAKATIANAPTRMRRIVLLHGVCGTTTRREIGNAPDCRVPVGLQHLHYRLLDQAVEHRRDMDFIMHLVQLGFGDGEAMRGELATQSRSL